MYLYIGSVEIWIYDNYLTYAQILTTQANFYSMTSFHLSLSINNHSYLVFFFGTLIHTPCGGARPISMSPLSLASKHSEIAQPVSCCLKKRLCIAMICLHLHVHGLVWLIWVQGATTCDQTSTLSSSIKGLAPCYLLFSS